MRYYIAFDGGGSKLQGILFDETGRVLNTGLSGGINSNVHSLDAVQQHVEDCVAQLFAGLENPPAEIEGLISSQYTSEYRTEVERYAPCRDLLGGGEGLLGVLACGVANGLCALAGTGSDVFLIRNGKNVDTIGGWGYLLGDDGSGVWIGVHAARELARATGGMVPKSLMTDMLEEAFQIHSSGDLIREVYGRKESPAFYLGSFCKVVQQAAELGDATAIRILRESGEALARQAELLIEKHNLGSTLPMCLTGSVLRHCRAMREGFSAYLRKRYPELKIIRPKFEPVVGAVILGLLHSGKTLDEALLEMLSESCKVFRIDAD